MIVFGSSLSPFVRKVLVIAAEKGIAVENRVVPLGSTDPTFRAASPFGKIPALQDGDFCISDSSAIINYFEAVKPEPAMIPAEARARARAIWYDEFADTIFVACAGKLFFNRVVAPRFLKQAGDLAMADKAEKEALPPLLAYLEGVIPASGFLVEDQFTLADASVATGFVNLGHVGCAIDPITYPKTSAYVAGILARPSFAPIVAAEKAFMAA